MRGLAAVIAAPQDIATYTDLCGILPGGALTTS